jgi:hypothetical protein
MGEKALAHQQNKESSLRAQEKKRSLSWKIEIIKAIVLLCFFAFWRGL